MITNDQIIEAARECGVVYSALFELCEMQPQELAKLSHHFYRQGLLDAAEKCQATAYMNCYIEAGHDAVNDCIEALRQMAEEIK